MKQLGWALRIAASIWVLVVGFAQCHLFAAASVSLSDAVYGSCGNLSISAAAVTAAGDTVAQFYWNWGDGSTNGSSSSGGHHYAANGGFLIQVVAVTTNGDSLVAGKKVTVANALDPGCPQTSTGPYYLMSTVAGVDFGAANTITAAGVPIYNVFPRITVDAHDNLYISDYFGSRVWRVTPAGRATVVAGNGSARDVFYGSAPADTLFPGPSLPLHPITAAADNDGNVYILGAKYTDALNAYLYKVNSAGSWLLGTLSPNLFGSATGMAVDPSHNVYVGSSYGVWKIGPTGKVTAYSKTPVSNLQWTGGKLYFGGAGVIGSFDSTLQPSSLAQTPNGPAAVDMDGNIYYCSQYSIWKITADGLTVRVAGTGVPGFSGDGGPAASAKVNCTDLAVDGSGTIYIADTGYTLTGYSAADYTTNPRIRKISAGLIDTLAGGGERDVLASETAFLGPDTVVALPGGDLLVADQKISQASELSPFGFRRIAPDGHWKFINFPLPNSGIAAAAYRNGVLYTVRKDAQFVSHIFGLNPDGTVSSDLTVRGSDVLTLSGLATDSSGTFYVAGLGRVGTDATAARLWKIGEGGAAQAILDVSGAQNTFFPDVCVDATGNLFFAADSRVLRITPQGVITTVAGNGTVGFSGDGGPATAAQLHFASSVAVDAQGNLYIADMVNRRVRMVATDGIIHTIAVTGGSPQATDGFQTPQSYFDAPNRITVDSAGNVYFSETANGVVRKLTANRPAKATATAGDLQHASVDSALAQPLMLQVTGQTGVPVEAVPITWKVTSGVATLTAASSLTDASGKARMTMTLGSDAGPVSITATAFGLPSVQFTAIADGRPAFLVGPGSLVGAAGRPVPVTVGVLDGKRSPVPGVEVSFTVSGGAATLSNASALTGLDGSANITVTIPSASVVGVVVSVAGLPELRLRLTAINAPSIAAGGVANVFVPIGVLAPGSFASLYGTNLASTTATAGAALTTTIANTSVKVNGKLAPILFVSPNQINFFVPYDTPIGSCPVIAVYQGVESLPVAVSIAPTAPGLVRAILNQDFSTNSASNPAKAGSYVVLYGTGAGAVSPPVSEIGAAPSGPLSMISADVTVLIDKAPAAISFAGLAPGSVGLFQINLQVPQLPSGLYPVAVSIGGVSSNVLSLAVTQ